MAAATPAWARGMPETAALVIGAFTSPNPMPKITYAVNSQVNGVVALSPTSISEEPVRVEAGHEEGNPGAALADDAPRDRGEQHGHGGHGQRVDPGLQSGEATHVLQVERIEEEESTERGEGRDGDDGGGREGHGAEEAQVDERLDRPALPDQERSQRDRGDGERRR